MDYQDYELECRECHRKILAEVVLFGVNHNAYVSVICGDCLKISPVFEEKQPEAVKRIKEWLAKK